jgi:hypothetical protein
MSNTDKLIDELSNNLQRSGRAPNVDIMAALWLLASAVYVVFIIHWFGPIRPNALQQLATEPRFLMETLCGLIAIVFVSLSAFRAAVPGALNSRFALWGWALTLLWVSCYVVGLNYPALEPSMLGKRHGCMYETLIYALPPMVLGFILTRRLYPLRPVATALSFSLAAGMIPALYMQIACMYSPAHILQFHILPGALVALLGAAIGWSLMWGKRLGN